MQSKWRAMRKQFENQMYILRKTTKSSWELIYWFVLNVLPIIMDYCCCLCCKNSLNKIYKSLFVVFSNLSPQYINGTPSLPYFTIFVDIELNSQFWYNLCCNWTVISQIRYHNYHSIIRCAYRLFRYVLVGRKEEPNYP